MALFYYRQDGKLLRLFSSPISKSLCRCCRVYGIRDNQEEEFVVPGVNEVVQPSDFKDVYGCYERGRSNKFRVEFLLATWKLHSFELLVALECWDPFERRLVCSLSRASWNSMQSMKVEIDGNKLVAGDGWLDILQRCAAKFCKNPLEQ
uniref:Uncharacterized protein n=1 Tax=Cucumis melo TaxID=3656 RepID=A0A9I9EK30_CUCME